MIILQHHSLGRTERNYFPKYAMDQICEGKIIILETSNGHNYQVAIKRQLIKLVVSTKFY